MASNFLSLNPAKTEFLLIGLPAKLSKIHNPTLTISLTTIIQPVSSARNLGIIFDSNISFSDHISYISLHFIHTYIHFIHTYMFIFSWFIWQRAEIKIIISKSCFSHIRDLRRIRNTLDHKTACTIATSLIHSKLDYCYSLYLNISNQQLNRLQLILNSAARAVTKTQKFHHIYLLRISNHFTGSKSRNAYTIQNSFTNLQITSVQQTFLHFWSSHHTTHSFYPLICSCHSPTPFKSL